MTVCIAAFANNSQAIVMAADKAITYGSGSAMQADSDVEKIMSIGKSGWNVLVAGSPSLAEKIIRAAENDLKDHPDTKKSADDMASLIQHTYQSIRKQALIDQILRPRLLTEELYIARPNTLLPLQEEYFTAVAEAIEEFKFSCALLLCGFDGQGKPHIFSIRNPGLVESEDMTGYATIGIGDEIAYGRLLWRKFTRKNKLDEALFAILDAKAHAELIQGVGYGWDARVMVKDRAFKVPQGIKNLLDDLFDESSKSPFEKRKYPRNWRAKLRVFSEKILKGKA